MTEDKGEEKGQGKGGEDWRKRGREAYLLGVQCSTAPRPALPCPAPCSIGCSEGGCLCDLRVADPVKRAV
jgi:hypothetical protein